MYLKWMLSFIKKKNMKIYTDKIIKCCFVNKKIFLNLNTFRWEVEKINKIDIHDKIRKKN